MKSFLLTAGALAALVVLAAPAASYAEGHRGDGRHASAARHAHHRTERARHEAHVDRRHARHVAHVDRRLASHRAHIDHRHAVRVDTHRDARVAAVGARWNRANPNWWRGRAEFRGYAGRRPGFWYHPGFGYVRPDPRWYGYRWRVGGFVPAPYRGWAVPNPYFYGLGPARPGYRWIWLDNNIVLMAAATGAIVQVVPGVY